MPHAKLTAPPNPAPEVAHARRVEELKAKRPQLTPAETGELLDLLLADYDTARGRPAPAATGRR